LHWLSTCRDAFLFEDCVEDSPLRHELTHERIQAVDGWMTVPDRPGLGITLNEDFVKAHLVDESGSHLHAGDSHSNGNHTASSGKNLHPHLHKYSKPVEISAL
jgi:hypothetical protein